MSVIGYREKINLLNNKDDLFIKLQKINNYSESHAENVKYEILNISGDEFYLVSDDRDNLLETTALNTHRITKFDEDFKNDVEEALEYLKQNFEEFYIVIKENVKYIVNLTLKEDSRDIDSTITSCSLPSLPYVIFISYKAGYHIPPSNVISTKNKVLLAENIYHEAIHQIVNMSILKKNVLPKNYSSATSPKIDIPWRKQQKEERNKAWELDRVLHATSVYANLLQFRKKMLNEIVNNDFKEFYKEACNSGEKSFNHLLNSLYEKIDYFDVDGKDIIENIKTYYS